MPLWTIVEVRSGGPTESFRDSVACRLSRCFECAVSVVLGVLSGRQHLHGKVEISEGTPAAPVQRTQVEKRRLSVYTVEPALNPSVILNPPCPMITSLRFLLPLVPSLLVAIPCATADEPQPNVSFRNEVMAVLSKSGCNLGTCHGNANGKGGLKLSLRGQDPDVDYVTLTRGLAARRVSPLQPDSSLLLQKPLMAVPHEGGQRFLESSTEYGTLRDWIAAGMPDDVETAPELIGLSVTPKHATVYAPDSSVKLTAEAKFSDGSVRDVTSLAVLESSAITTDVTSDGTVSADEAAMTTVLVRYLNQQQPARLEFVAAAPDFTFEAPEPQNFVDEAVFAQLKRLRVNPAPLSDDPTFLRRAFLDLTGLLPTSAQTQAFLKSADPQKRSALIDRLLDSEEFVDFQTLRWADLLRAEQKTLDEKGLRIYHDWIRSRIAENQPLNEFAAELIAARGSTYKVPAANFYRALRKPDARAEAVAQVFLGIRLQCAKCHNHPFDRWTQDDYYAWTNYFARVDYKIIENKRRDKSDKNEFSGEQIVQMKDKGDVKNPGTGQTAGLRFLGDSNVDTAARRIKNATVQAVAKPAADVADEKNASATDASSATPPDRLQRLAEWLGDPSNERFAASQANRVWAQVVGYGLVDPVDDFRSTNPAVCPELLDGLTREFVEHNFDVRHLMRVIMNSATYQLAAVDSSATQITPLAGTVPRRLTAEQTLDAIAQVLNTSVRFGGHERGTKAVQLVGVRNGDFRYAKPEIGDQFLKLFGKPNRLQSCECERSGETTLAQTFEMVSGELVAKLIAKSGNVIDEALQKSQGTADVVEELYLAAFCRRPTDAERADIASYVKNHEDARAALEDIAWALLNSNEFLLRR